MKKVIIFLIALVALAECQGFGFPISMVPHIGTLKISKPPKYRLDLNVEPRHRWDHIVPAFKAPMQKFTKYVLDNLPLSQTFWVSFGLFCESQRKYSEFVQEVKGIADILEVQWQKLMLANFMYDISAILPHPSKRAKWCTSIIARNKDNKIIHGRNLDFWPWALFSKDSAVIEVYRGNQYIAEWDQIIGSVFVLSGIKNQSFSVTVDTRKMENDKTVDNLNDLIENIVVKKYVPSCFLTRILLTTDGITYDQAFEAFKSTNVTAPIYYTVAGIDKGAVIEKNPVGTHGVYEVTPDSKDWYVVVTNYDKEENPGQDDRKTPACKRLEEIGQVNINTTNFFEMMQKYPTMNIATIMTTMMMPSANYNDATVWYGNIDDFKGSNLRGDYENDPDFYIEDPYYRELQNNEFPEQSDVVLMQDYFLAFMGVYNKYLKSE